MSTRKEAHIQIVETTFRSCFCFRFLKYPLLLKSRFFSGTRNITVVSFRFSVILKYFGYPKRNDFFKKRIFSFLETFGNEKKKRK